MAFVSCPLSGNFAKNVFYNFFIYGHQRTLAPWRCIWTSKCPRTAYYIPMAPYRDSTSTAHYREAPYEDPANIISYSPPRIVQINFVFSPKLHQNLVTRRTHALKDSK